MTWLSRGLLLMLAVMAAVMPGVGGSSPPPASREPQKIMVMLHEAKTGMPGRSGYGGAYGDVLWQSAARSKARSIAKRLGFTIVEAWPMPLLKVGCIVMAIPDGISVADAVAAAANDSAVAWSEPLHEYETQSSHGFNDPLAPTQPAVSQWQLATLHQAATGHGVRIALVDSGLDRRHPDFAGQNIRIENFVAGSEATPERHGTEMAGVILARINNRIGIAGIAPMARLTNLRACREDSPETTAKCDSLSLAKALQFAVESKADVINLSLAGPQNRLLSDLIRLAISRNIIVVAAYAKSIPGGGFPASAAGVLAVSDGGARVAETGAFTAPGSHIPTTAAGGGWTFINGSSASSAHVTGLLALLLQTRPKQIAIENLRSGRHRDGSINACQAFFGNRRKCE